MSNSKFLARFQNRMHTVGANGEVEPHAGGARKSNGARAHPPSQTRKPGRRRSGPRSQRVRPVSPVQSPGSAGGGGAVHGFGYAGAAAGGGGGGGQQPQVRVGSAKISASPVYNIPVGGYDAVVPSMPPVTVTSTSSPPVQHFHYDDTTPTYHPQPVHPARRYTGGSAGSKPTTGRSAGSAGRQRRRVVQRSEPQQPSRAAPASQGPPKKASKPGIADLKSVMTHGLDSGDSRGGSARSHPHGARHLGGAVSAMPTHASAAVSSPMAMRSQSVGAATYYSHAAAAHRPADHAAVAVAGGGGGGGSGGGGMPMLPDDDLHGGAASLESDMHFDLGAPDSLDLPAGEYDSYAGLPAGNGYDDSPMGGHVHSQPHSHGDGSGGGSGGYAASRGGYSSGSAKPAGSQRSMDTHRTNSSRPSRGARARGGRKQGGGGGSSSSSNNQPRARDMAYLQQPSYNFEAGKDPRKLNEERVQNSQDQLYYSRKARHVEYKPATLQDYKHVAPKKYVELGSLGADLNTDELVAKRANKERIKAFDRQLRQVNAQKQREAAAKPKSPKAPAPKVPSKREKALEFSKRVPKPKVRPSRNRDSSAGSKRGVGSHRGRSGGGGGGKEVQGELSGLDKLEMQHDSMRQDVDAIRREFGL